MPKTPWRTIDHPYVLSRHLIPFMQDCPFYAEMSRHIHKRPTVDIPTAAVSYDVEADELVMWYNPYFMGGGTYQDAQGNTVVEEGLENWETRGVITHEFDHPLYGHLSARRRQPDDVDNVAKDLAINSLIVSRQGQPRNAQKGVWERQLPRLALIPGQRPWIDPTKMAKMSPERKKAVEHLADLIEKFPKEKASEWYFARILEDQKKNPNMYPKGEDVGCGVIVPLDRHDGFDEVPEGMREFVEGKVKAIIEKAVRHADSHADGWGNIPAELRDEIRRSVSSIVNWRNVLRQFVGTLVRGNRTTSIKRINRRYPYVHPGVKRGYTAKLLLAIDQSGSVDDVMLEMFFAELEQLTRKVDITVLPFDCACNEKDIFEWKKGARPHLRRVRAGGTDFNAPTVLANDPKNRGRWDGMLIMTDGQAPAPTASRIKRGWVLGQGCTLIFPSDEVQIFLTNEKQVSGAWK